METKLDIKSLSEYGKNFDKRRYELRKEARDKIAEILSNLPGNELLSDEILGWFLWQNGSDEWVESGIHGLKLLEENIIVTSDIDYDNNNNLFVDDWDDSLRDMTFDEQDDYVNINWEATLLQVISELELIDWRNKDENQTENNWEK